MVPLPNSLCPPRSPKNQAEANAWASYCAATISRPRVSTH